MKMQPSNIPVTRFIAEIQDENKRQSCIELCEMMEKITSAPPVIWGDKIVGFGSYHYKYQSGREGEWFLTGFSPRKNHISIYIMNGFDKYESYLQKLGKVKTSVSCLYVKRLSTIDTSILASLISDSVKQLKKRYNA